MKSSADVSRLVSFEDWEAKAKEILGDGVYDYISEGAGEELTVAENRKGLEKYRIIPRVLMGIREVSTVTNIIGLKLSSPIILAPVGGQGIFHPDGDIETAKGAATTDTTLCVSTVSTKSMEEISKHMGKSHKVFQLYLHDDDGFNRNLVKRAEKSGYESIMLTVDGPSIGRRLRTLRNGFSMAGFTGGNFLVDDNRADRKNGGVFRPSLKKDINWEDVDALRSVTRLPIILKGITSSVDARTAVEHKVDAIVVSNHGGRQLDGVISSMDALRQIKEVVGDQIDLILDGGIRSGSDILKALCLGAKAVMIGRPYVYGLAVAGSSGVEKVIRDLQDDLKISMLNSGMSRIEDADESYLFSG